MPLLGSVLDDDAHLSAGPAQREIRNLIANASSARRAAIYRVELARIRPVVAQFFASDLGVREIDALLRIVMLQGMADMTRAASARTSAEDMIGALYDADELGYPMSAAKVVSASLCELSPRAWDHAEDCPDHVIELAGSIAGEDALTREAHWQLAMIGKLLAAEEITEADIDSASEEPAWLPSFCRAHPKPIGFGKPQTKPL